MTTENNGGWRHRKQINTNLLRLTPVFAALAIFLFLSGFNVFLHNHEFGSGHHEDCPVFPIIVMLETVLVVFGVVLIRYIALIVPVIVREIRHCPHQIRRRSLGRAPPHI